MDLPIPETLLEAVHAFANKQVAHEFFVRLRWPNGIACPRHGCGSADVSAIGGRNAWRCRECKMHFTAKVGTVFEDSPIGFDKWLPAMWLLSSCRNGVSSCELARHLKITQKTAWFMLHRLRLAMRTETFEKLNGVVEVDETYIGGKIKNKPRRVREQPRGDSMEDKAPVLGMIQRGGRAHAVHRQGATSARCCPR
jgi:transposase-like protein